MPDINTQKQPSINLVAEQINQPKPKKKWLKWLVLTPLFILWIVSIITVIILRKKYIIFEQNSGLSIKSLQAIAEKGYQKGQLYQAQNKTNTTILLLGADGLDNRGDIPPLTDTMMIVRLHFDTGTINVLSLPRDIWSEAYQTKINALLAYGYEKNSNNPTAFPAKIISELTHIHIDHALVLSLDQLKELINLVGGVEINVKQSFVDNEFPRDDVDIYTETDPDKLYETISFKAGPQLMNGQTALKYIRSRKSTGEQGNDIARGERQQEIFQAFFLKLKNYRYFYDHPDVAGKLIRFYQDHYSQNFSFVDMTATMTALLPAMDKLEIIGQTLSTDPNDPNGVLYNPPDFKFENLWVYTIKDLQNFQQEVLKKLNSKNN